ncbi:hypothetical protein [Flexistipes sp.]|uniref:hypothetical protein n=1 Tax=Flexistipes sp. TaxID=3088135 RepID=UPI002E23368C|nr:hypothetical protein [Flexistipes sp.]
MIVKAITFVVGVTGGGYLAVIIDIIAMIIIVMRLLVIQMICALGILKKVL